MTDFAGIDPVLAALEGHSRLLWALGVGFYGVGDTLTTAAGFWAGHAVEAGPVVAALLELAGLPGLLLVKLVVLAGFFAAWRVVHSPGRVGIPLALAVVGVAVTGWNGAVLVLGTTSAGPALIGAGVLP